MSDVVKISEFDNDITEYKEAEKRVADNFIFGVIELGKILKEKRDKYKPKGQWTEYLDEINKSMAGANQFIRIFEYSEANKKEFWLLNLTNWERINKFLALPEPLRLQLAQEISGQQISDEEFKDNLQKIKGEMPEEELNPSKDIDKWVDGAITNSFSRNAKLIVEQMNKQNPDITKESIPIVKGLLHLTMGMQYLDYSNIIMLNKKEKKEWLKMIVKNWNELGDIIKKLN